jgi:hypothetical protein
MTTRINHLGRGFLAAGLLALSSTTFSAPVDIIYVGTWDNTASGNSTGSGGPGLTVGQKYVIKISYDTAGFTDNVVVKDAFGNGTNKLMTTVNLQGAGNSLDIFAPMEGLDAGSPFIYTQNETNHFFYGINSPVPTLNFANGSDVSNKANVIGLEFEGDFVPGAGQNVVEFFNTATDTSAITAVNRVNNLAAAPAANDTSPFQEAVALEVDAGAAIVYDAATLVKMTGSSIVQSNDLGAGRSDGEDFVDTSWSVTGGPSGDDISVAIADSGLTNTTSTTDWTFSGTEQMTGLSDSDTTMVSYLNANPTLSASAAQGATDVNFSLTADDADLIVNAIIAGFEQLTLTAMVDAAIDATAFFSDLFSTGVQLESMADLAAAFGAGVHSVVFTVTDLAGAMTTASAAFDAGTITPPNPAPSPASNLLLALGLLVLAWMYRSKKTAGTLQQVPNQNDIAR